jgi:hypothetical protein
VAEIGPGLIFWPKAPEQLPFSSEEEDSFLFWQPTKRRRSAARLTVPFQFSISLLE